MDTAAVVVGSLNRAVSKGARSVATGFPGVDGGLGKQSTRELLVKREAQLKVIEKIKHVILLVLLADLTVVGTAAARMSESNF